MLDKSWGVPCDESVPSLSRMICGCICGNRFAIFVVVVARRRRGWSSRDRLDAEEVVQ